MLHLVLALSAELSCRSGPESGDPVGGAATTPERTSSSIYPCFCSLDLFCFCLGWEAGSRSLCLAFFPVLTMGQGRVPCVELAVVLSPQPSAHFLLHILHILYGR